jgi:hypothetical protein
MLARCVSYTWPSGNPIWKISLPKDLASAQASWLVWTKTASLAVCWFYPYRPAGSAVAGPPRQTWAVETTEFTWKTNFILFILFIPCILIKILQLNPTTYILVIILISQKFFYMFRAMKFHHQEVSCRIQALWFNIVYYGESSICIICRLE